MNKVILAISLIATFSVASTSCARKVTRIEPTEQIDLSGRWNNTDSRFVAEEMIGTILNDKWVSDHQQAQNGQKPVVIVGFVNNKSHEHIEAETFVKDVEQSFIKSGKLRLVQG
ncbi:MAG: penicillin-binding protein activator LpoB, partial [Chitinophagaceae bacterium]